MFSVFTSRYERRYYSHNVPTLETRVIAVYEYRSYYFSHYSMILNPNVGTKINIGSYNYTLFVCNELPSSLNYKNRYKLYFYK